jgi:hypothetical protein
MTVFSIVLQSLLVLYYAFSGGAKIAGAKYWADIFKNLGLPQWFRVVTGIVQLVGTALLIIGYWYVGAVGWHLAWSHYVIGVSRAFQGQRSNQQNGSGHRFYCVNHHSNRH